MISVVTSNKFPRSDSIVFQIENIESLKKKIENEKSASKKNKETYIHVLGKLCSV